MVVKDLTQRHFRTLGLLSDANENEIKCAYLRMARAHHPDRNYGDPDAADRFKEIQLAYESLSKRVAKPKTQKSEQFPFITPESSKFNTSRLCGITCAALFVLTASLWRLFQNEWWLAKQHLPEPVASVLSSESLPERIVPSPSGTDIPTRLDTPNDSREVVPASDLGGTFEDLRVLEDGLIEDLAQASYSTTKPYTTTSSLFEQRATPNLPVPTTNAATIEGPYTVEYFHSQPDNSETWPNNINYDHPINANRDSDFSSSLSACVSWESKHQTFDNFPSELSYRIGDEQHRNFSSPAQQLPLNKSLPDYSSGTFPRSHSASTPWPPAHRSLKSMPAFSNTVSSSFETTIDQYRPRTSPAPLQSVTKVYPRDWYYSSSVNRLEPGQHVQRTPSHHEELENSWSASLGMSRPQESSFHKQKSRRDWSPPVERYNFSSFPGAYSQTAVVHSKASREISNSSNWNSVGDLGQAVPKNASYTSTDKYKSANWHLLDGPENDGSRTGWRGYEESEPIRSSPKKWTAHSNRVKVHKTVLQPYSSKAAGTRDKKPVYHPVHASGHFYSTRTSSPATSSWKSPSSNW